MLKKHMIEEVSKLLGTPGGGGGGGVIQYKDVVLPV